jgi:hypothetical protein
MNLSAKIQSVFYVHEGLCDGLSHFSGPSRAALVYAETKEDPPRIYDPQRLLEGHEPMLEKHFLRSDAWRKSIPDIHQTRIFGQIFPEKNMQLAGLICCGGRTRSIFYQMWFTEQHPTICSTGPTRKWLEHAVCLLTQDYANEDWFLTRNSQYVLREYATHAVQDYIREELDKKFGLDSRIEVYPILDAVLGISKTREEGAWPRGTLVFIDPSMIPEVSFLVRFPYPEKLKIGNFKHVRKLILAVENSDCRLVSDGQRIIGVASGLMPKCRITAEFRGGYGFLRFSGELVCSFSDGSFHSSNRRPNLVQLEETLLESSLEPSNKDQLFKIVSGIVRKAGEQRHGASIVVDLNQNPLSISGQQLEKPIDLREERMLDLAKSLSKVDGALHIGADLNLHGFACLLDGRSVRNENRARGARFNSALRFTAEHENIVVVVVSADRPVSVFQGGIDLTAKQEWEPLTPLIALPLTLEDWLRISGEQDPRINTPLVLP